MLWKCVFRFPKLLAIWMVMHEQMYFYQDLTTKRYKKWWVFLWRRASIGRSHDLMLNTFSRLWSKYFLWVLVHRDFLRCPLVRGDLPRILFQARDIKTLQMSWQLIVHINLIPSPSPWRTSEYWCLVFNLQRDMWPLEFMSMHEKNNACIYIILQEKIISA